MISTAINLQEVADEYKQKSKCIQKRIVICAGTGCIANGSLKIYEALKNELNEAGLDVVLEVNKGFLCHGAIIGNLSKRHPLQQG